MVSAMQATLFGGGEPAFDERFATLEHHDLTCGAWVEYAPNWLSGDQSLFEHLVETTTWHASSRPMYDRIVDVPRLTASVPRDGKGHPILRRIGKLLSERYGEPMRGISMARYRDGNDSVAPHGDQIARDLDTTVMAIVSLGARRHFTLRAVDSSGSTAFDLGEGDLIVMGGTIQRTWLHGVPKTARPVGPRICVMFRPPWLG